MRPSSATRVQLGTDRRPPAPERPDGLGRVLDGMRGLAVAPPVADYPIAIRAVSPVKWD
jgi:hypothetical protein